MMLLARKLRRELWAQKGQALAVLTVTSLGVFLFISSATGYLDLRDSYADTRERLALADLHVKAPALTHEQVARIAQAPGVATAQGRVVASLPATVTSGSPEKPRHLELRVLSLPDSGQPRLDKVLVLSGALPDGPGELLVEKHLAARHGLKAGDTLEVRAPGLARTLTVSGVAVSAEYLWVTRGESDLFPSPDAFGVAFMRRGALREVAAALTAAGPGAAQGLSGLAAAAGDGPGNELLVERAEGGTWAQAEDAVKAALGPAQVPVREHDLPGVKLLQMDVDGYKGMAAFFPVFFLGVGAFILASVLSRRVDAQRPLVGTLTALGVGRARVLGHYLSYALVLGLGGALLGAALGVASGKALTHEYAKELGIPFVTARLHWDLALWGVLLGAGVALLSGWLPAFRASRLHPAEAMRPSRPSTGALARLVRGLRAPLWIRMAARGVLGRPVRSAGTALGVSAALVLVLVTGALLDSMRVALHTLFKEAQTYDVRVDLVAPQPQAEVERRLGALEGAAEVETLAALPVQLGHGGAWEDALLQGLTKDPALLRPLDLDGTPRAPKEGALVLTRALAEDLGVAPGDEVTARFAPTGAEATFEVGGYADAVMGPVVSARLEDVQEAFGLKDAVTSILLRAEPGKADALRAAAAKLPDAGRVQDLATLRSQMDQLMGLGWVMLGTMLLFSVVLAAAILFNTATLNIVERRRELATLRALGRTMREIAFGLTLEHAALAVLGFAVGLPLAQAATRHVLGLFSGDLFSLPYVMSPATVAAAGLGVAAVLLLAQWPGLRSVARAPLATAVRSAEG